MTDTQHAVRDVPQMIHVSGLVDGLRDCTLHLVASDAPDEEARVMLVAQYHQLYQAGNDLVTDVFAAEYDQRVPQLEANASLSTIYIAASLLARWLDLAQTNANAIIAQEANTLQLKKAQAELAKSSAQAAPGNYI